MGNLLLERSFATRANGQTMDLVDVYFRIDQRPGKEAQPTAETRKQSSASITVKSQPNKVPVKVIGSQGPLFIANGAVMLGQMSQSVNMPVIDWSGSAGLSRIGSAVLLDNSRSDWVNDFLGNKTKQKIEKDLVKITGLKVAIANK